MPPHLLGATVAASFGLVYVLLNSGALPGPLSAALRAAAVVAAAVVVAGVVRWRRQPVSPQDTGGLSRGYLLICVAEVAAIVVGSRLLAGPLDLPQAGIAWVTTVVGLHFVPLAVLWRRPLFHLLAGLLTTLGAAGLLLAVGGAEQPTVALVAGAGAGLVLLGFGLWAVSPAQQHPSVRTAARR